MHTCLLMGGEVFEVGLALHVVAEGAQGRVCCSVDCLGRLNEHPCYTDTPSQQRTDAPGFCRYIYGRAFISHEILNAFFVCFRVRSEVF